MLMFNSIVSVLVMVLLNIDVFVGVLCFLLMCENYFGSKLFCVIIMKMRGCFIIESNSDVVMAATASMDMMVVIVGILYVVNVIVNGVLMLMLLYEIMFVIMMYIV